MDQKKFCDFVVYQPWKTLGFSLVLMLVIGVFLKDVAPSVSYKDMLGEDYPLLQAYERVQSEYTNDDNLLVLIEAKQGNAFSQEILAGVKDLTATLWKTPHVVRVDSITNFQHTEADEDSLVVADLVEDPEQLDAAMIAKIKRIAVSEPQLLNRATNAQGNVLAINVSFAFPNKSLNEKLDADAFVQQAVAELRETLPQINAYVAGLVALDAAVMRISQQESGMFLMLILAVVVVLLIVVLRALKPVLVTVFVVLFSVVAGMAFSGMMGWKLTPFTASVPMMILVLAVADSVHYIASFVHNLRRDMNKREALVGALELNLKPIAITSITTAIGFLTLNFSESESIGALGSQVAFGVMVAFALSVTLLPAALSLLPIKVRSRREQPSDLHERLAGLIVRFKGRILLLSALLCVGLGLFISENEFNDNIPTYFAESLPWRQANDFAEREFGGAYTFSYSLRAGAAEGIAEPAFLQDIERFIIWLRSMPEVAHVSTVTDTVKRLNKSMHADDPAYYQLPDDKALTAQYILLYEMSLPYGLDLNNQINFDKSATKVIVTFETLSTKEVLKFEDKINQWLTVNIPSIEVEGTGVQMMFAHLLDKDTKGLIWGAVFGLFIISLLLMLAFKSVALGLVSVLPNLAPIAVAFGLWGLLVGQVGMGMAMVSGITIGIVVDDTVHFLHKFLVGKREKFLSDQKAIAYAYQHAGSAILLTTFVLVAGFASMALLSEFRVNSDMGKMACIVMLAALLLDMITLPALLAWIDEKVALRSKRAELLEVNQA